MKLFYKEFNRPRPVVLALVLILISALFLTACGDTAANATPASGKTTPTPMSNAQLAQQAGTTPGAAGAKTSGNTANSPGAAGGSASAGTPGALPSAAPALPTPTGTASATIPDLAYPGGREIKASDATAKALENNFSDPGAEEYLGKFTPSKIGIYLSPDGNDKIEEFYKKALEGAGFQQNNRNNSATASLIVYQKGGTKVVLQTADIPSIQSFPAEFSSVYKTGDRLILLASGSSFTVPPTPFAVPGAATLPVGPGQKKIATIEMENGGIITIELFPDIAPKTVENFEKLANKGFYNGLIFHRVEKDPQPFVVQGGDPKGDGTGGPGYTIPDEFTTQKKHVAGTVAMAHSSAPNSAGSQFYITLAPAPFLDGKYAIFGQVMDGMDVVNKIKVGDKMKSVKVEVK